jgi:hypothetical protein
MSEQTLEKLYKERRLIKELISIDRERYSHLNERSNEIKTIINSEYSPISNSQSVFALFDLELSQKITERAKDTLTELIKGEE